MRYFILYELINNSWLLIMCTASCMLTIHCPAKWCNACSVIVLTPLISWSCVLFVLYNGKGIASQVIPVIQNLNNAFIDLREDVHIIQYSNITSYFTHFMMIFWIASISACDVLCLLPVYDTTYLDTSSISLISGQFGFK